VYVKSVCCTDLTCLKHSSTSFAACCFTVSIFSCCSLTINPSHVAMTESSKGGNGCDSKPWNYHILIHYQLRCRPSNLCVIDLFLKTTPTLNGLSLSLCMCVCVHARVCVLDIIKAWAQVFVMFIILTEL